jgi:hypothetical protein
VPTLQEKDIVKSIFYLFKRCTSNNSKSGLINIKTAVLTLKWVPDISSEDLQAFVTKTSKLAQSLICGVINREGWSEVAGLIYSLFVSPE